MALQTILNGVNVTSFTLEGSVTHQHNQPSFATIRIPSSLAPSTTNWWDYGNWRLKVSIDSVLDFHGMLALIEDEGDENTIYTTFTFASPSSIWEFRPVRDADGDFSKPSIITDFVTAPQIVQKALTNSTVSTDPAIGEGPMGIALGAFAAGGVNLSGTPADWPMSLAHLFALMEETGELDIVETPIDDGTNMALVSAYNGDYGTDRSGIVSFKFAMGTASNCRGARRTLDFQELMNKLWIYGGPRQLTARDPKGDQHWKFNITRDDPGLASYPEYPSLYSLIAVSRSAFFPRMYIRIFDAASEAEGAVSRELYRRWWMMESYVRLKAKTLVHLHPHRGIAPAFRTGDIISVQAGTPFRGGFSGVQRVMAYTYRWGTEGVIELGEPVGQAAVPAVVTTADTEGF